MAVEVISQKIEISLIISGEVGREHSDLRRFTAEHKKEESVAIYLSFIHSFTL